MGSEMVLADMVRAWTERQLVNGGDVARRAEMIALSSYAGGASIAESCEEARRFVESWIHHPSHWQPFDQDTLRRVS